MSFLSYPAPRACTARPCSICGNAYAADERDHDQQEQGPQQQQQQQKLEGGDDSIQTPLGPTLATLDFTTFANLARQILVGALWGEAGLCSECCDRLLQALRQQYLARYYVEEACSLKPDDETAQSLSEQLQFSEGQAIRADETLYTAPPTAPPPQLPLSDRSQAELDAGPDKGRWPAPYTPYLRGELSSYDQYYIAIARESVSNGDYRRAFQALISPSQPAKETPEWRQLLAICRLHLAVDYALAEHADPEREKTGFGSVFRLLDGVAGAINSEADKEILRFCRLQLARAYVNSSYGAITTAGNLEEAGVLAEAIAASTDIEEEREWAHKELSTIAVHFGSREVQRLNGIRQALVNPG